MTGHCKHCGEQGSHECKPTSDNPMEAAYNKIQSHLIMMVSSSDANKILEQVDIILTACMQASTQLEKRCAKLEAVLAESAVVILAMEVSTHSPEMQQQIETVKPMIIKALKGGDDE